MNIIQLVMSYAAMEAQNRMKEAISPVAPYLRRLMFGVALTLSGVVGIWLALIFFAASLFLGLTDMTNYVMPAVWTGLIFLGIGLICFGAGIITIRRPR